LARLERLASNEDGQSIVELAIMLPVVLLLLFGAIDFGQYMYTSIHVGNAARAGVQFGAQSDTTAGDTAGMNAAALADAPEITSMTATSSNYCTCDSTQLTQFACSTITSATCPAPDHVDVFVQVTATDNLTPLISFASLPSPTAVSQTAIQLVTN
jgi:Flp pilus assembly protein TadG